MIPIESLTDPLFDVELMIARRADELSRGTAVAGRNALDLWRQAEHEVLEASLGESADFRSAH